MKGKRSPFKLQRDGVHKFGFLARMDYCCEHCSEDRPREANSYGRTRSEQWRSGTRRTKRLSRR